MNPGNEHRAVTGVTGGCAARTFRETQGHAAGRANVGAERIGYNDGLMSERKRITHRTAAAEYPFSDAVLAGDTLYISGKIGFDPSTGKPGATPELEARLVMDDLKGTVEAAGMTMDDLVQVQVFCPDLTCFDAFNAVYRGYFPHGFPARAFLGSGTLLFGARFEVMAIAVRRS